MIGDSIKNMFRTWIVGVGVVAIVLTFAMMTLGVNGIQHYQMLFESTTSEKAPKAETTVSKNKLKKETLVKMIFNDCEEDDDDEDV